MNATQKTPYVCHIQEMRPHSNKCYVFVEELGEKLVVAMSALVNIDASPPYSYHHRHQQYQRSTRREQPYRLSGHTVNSNYGGRTIDYRRSHYDGASAASTFGPTYSRTPSITTNSTTTTTTTVAAAGSAASNSSAAWVQNKTANGSVWLSSGGRRYCFTKNTCNQNKTTLLQPNDQHNRKPTYANKVLGDCHGRYAATASSSVERTKLFDDDDNDDEHASRTSRHVAGKLMQFNGFCSDSILGETPSRPLHCGGGGDGGDELSLQLRHLTSTMHFEPAPFETIAAPLIVTNSSGGAGNGGNYRTNHKQQQHNHNQSNKNAGKKKGEFEVRWFRCFALRGEIVCVWV